MRLWTPSEDALLSPFKSNVSRRGTGDPFIDAIRSESEAGEVRHTIRVGSVAFGTHAPSPLCVQDVQAFAQEGALRAAICESGPVMKALGECSAPFPPVIAVLLGCLLATSLCAIRSWRKKEAAAARPKTTENSGLLANGPSSAGEKAPSSM